MSNTELNADEEFVTMELEPENELQALLLNALINEGRMREREEIIEMLMKLENLSCCCDSATFGDHYLSERQPDSIITMIKNHRPSQ